MTQILKAERSMPAEIRKTFHPLICEWFDAKFRDFSEPQRYGVLNIWKKRNILISAPTGSGKTLTAFLSILNRLVTLAEKGELEDKVYALYISPLKALSNDIHKNLLEPLDEIQELAKLRKIKLQKIRVGLRTGDTTQSERAKMARKPPHILITTPESVAIMLTTKKFVESFRDVKYVIVDEIHSLENKRGVHLSLSLERINEMCEESGILIPVKVGLSATIEPLEEVAKFLVGNSEKREVRVAKVSFSKKIDIQVLSPAKNLIEHPNPRQPMYHLLNELISKHKTTLIFTNTRSATERVVNYFKDKFPTDYTDDNIAAHHSSLSKDHRFRIEEDLRDGKLKVVVCSTSLELGIDIGFIDLVILLGSPKASSRAIQRIGRAGHKLHDTAKGRFIVLDRDDLVECAIIQKEILEGKIDKIQYPRNCLDVLAQQIFGMAINKIWDADEMLKTIRKSHCYSNLTKSDFLSVISYLSGEYGLEKNWVYAKIWYDSAENKIGKKGKLARVIYSTNIGTIPEESFVTVKLAGTGEKIGALDEGFIGRMKKGDVFVLGGSTYVFAYTRGMNLYARPAPGRSPTIPSWFSEVLPLSFDTATEINSFRRSMRKKFEEKKSKKEIIDFIIKQTSVTDEIASQVYDYFEVQHNFSEIPHEKLLTIEKYIDERDDKKYLLFNSMYGRRVNDALSRAIAYLLGAGQKRDVEIGISDRGFYLSCENIDTIEKILGKLNSGNIEELLKEAIEKTDILTRRFRHCATRALMILRSYKGRQKNVKKLQMKSHFLISAVRKISREFPILKEAKREILEDLMDVNSAKIVLDMIADGKVKIKTDYVKLPSPFAVNLILQGHMDLMRIEDKQDFLKRMHRVYQEEIAKKTGKSKDDDFDYGEFLEDWENR